MTIKPLILQLLALSINRCQAQCQLERDKGGKHQCSARSESPQGLSLSLHGARIASYSNAR